MAWQKILTLGRALGGVVGWWKIAMLLISAGAIAAILQFVQGLSWSAVVVLFLILVALLLLVFVLGWHAYHLIAGVTGGSVEKKRIAAQFNEWVDAGMKNVERERVAALLAGTEDQNTEKFKTMTSWVFDAWSKDRDLLWAGNTFDAGPIRLSIPAMARHLTSRGKINRKHLSFDPYAISTSDIAVESPAVARDVWLQAVIWQKANAAVEGDDYANLTRLADFIGAIRQAASEGKLPIWGKLHTHDVWREIPAEHWSDHQIYLVSTTHEDPSEMHTEPTEHGAAPDVFKALMTSQFRVNELWP